MTHLSSPVVSARAFHPHVAPKTGLRLAVKTSPRFASPSSLVRLSGRSSSSSHAELLLALLQTEVARVEANEAGLLLP